MSDLIIIFSQTMIFVQIEIAKHNIKILFRSVCGVLMFNLFIQNFCTTFGEYAYDYNSNSFTK